MFSFMKWFGTLVENAKKKKGLWFTLLSAFSLIGIFVSLYFVNFLVSDVAQKTFVNQKNHYVLSFKNSVTTQSEYVEAVAIAISKNKDIADTFLSPSENSLKLATIKLESITQKLNTSLGKEQVFLKFVKQQKAENILGLEVTKGGTVFKSVIPMLDKNGTIAAIDVQKDIAVLVDSYKKEHKEFAFFLNASSMNKVDRAIKKKIYLNYHDKFFIKSGLYNQTFLDQIRLLTLDSFTEEDGFIKDSRYFYVYQKVYDHEGDFIGLAIIAEEIKDENSFVNLVKNLVNSVTMVALGLIVSMLLFLF